MKARIRFLLTTLAAAVFHAHSAVAAPAPTLVPAELRSALSDCACEADRDALLDAQREIAAAPTLDTAQERALDRSRLARRAIRTARWLAPASQDLAQAGERLEAYEERVRSAETPEQVAWEFGELVQLASLGTPVMADIDVDIDDGDGCDFSGGEIIAIVLGFLFGIIPGIILLILLC